MIKLAYKEYPYKMSLGAKKQYDGATGLDLWNVLLKYINSWRASEGLDTFKRLELLTGVCTTLQASELFYALIKAENSCISLIEIQDAMESVGGRPIEDDDEWCKPWPLVLVNLAYDVDAEYVNQLTKLKELNAKKKAGTSVQ